MNEYDKQWFLDFRLLIPKIIAVLKISSVLHSPKLVSVTLSQNSALKKDIIRVLPNFQLNMFQTRYFQPIISCAFPTLQSLDGEPAKEPRSRVPPASHHQREARVPLSPRRLASFGGGLKNDFSENTPIGRLNNNCQ